MPDQQGSTKARWVCPGCGSDEVEGLAWVRLNDEQITSYDECSSYWCPKCEDHFKGICEVDDHGHCLIHGRPFEQCRGQ